MGEIRVEIGLENFGDRYMCLEKKLPENEIKQHEMEAIVATGAVMLVLPQDVVEKLGLKVFRTVIVTYADERKEERWVVKGLEVTIGKRSMVTDCVIGPPLCEP